MRGIGRAAAHKSARQNTVEAQTQEISTIAMAPSEALVVPPAGDYALAQRKKVRQPTSHAKPNPASFHCLTGTYISLSSAAFCDLCSWQTMPQCQRAGLPIPGFAFERPNGEKSCVNLSKPDAVRRLDTPLSQTETLRWPFPACQLRLGGWLRKQPGAGRVVFDFS